MNNRNTIDLTIETTQYVIRQIPTLMLPEDGECLIWVMKYAILSLIKGFACVQLRPHDVIPTKPKRGSLRCQINREMLRFAKSHLFYSIKLADVGFFLE